VIPYGSFRKGWRSSPGLATWERFHTLQNLSALDASEAGELLAHFLWGEDALALRCDEAEAELADVFLGVLRFADVAGIDLNGAARKKLRSNARKYPPGSPGPTVTGSRSTLAGKRIVRAARYQNGGNPRRVGSHGHNAYELIPKDDRGILFEDLLAGIKRLPAKSSRAYGAGGTNHIWWDLEKGFTYVRDEGDE
jgi:NTP pyrophosphatase (non-canonical NTP hydrolase)